MLTTGLTATGSRTKTHQREENSSIKSYLAGLNPPYIFNPLWLTLSSAWWWKEKEKKALNVSSALQMLLLYLCNE